ncbi:MAG TPA: hypothetical protein VII63_09765 [Caulobacteraceae bacterium]
MSLEEMVAVAQIVGGAAVVVSLFYVGLQLRQNTMQLRRAAGDATLTQNSAFRMTIVNSREVAELWTRGLADEEPLDPPDLLRLEALFTERVWIAHHHWDRSRHGLSTRGQWERSTLKNLVRFLATRRGEAWWAGYKATMPPQYAAAVDKGIGEPTGEP